MASAEYDDDDPLLVPRTSSGISTTSTRSTPVLYRRRWFMLLIVGYLQISNAMNWMSYAPVADIAAEHYHTTSFVINLLSMTFMIVYIPLGFVSTYLIKSKGLRYAVVIAAFGNVLGPAIRYAGDFFIDSTMQLVFQFIGQAVAAAAQPTILGSTTPLAATWFGEKERATANTIGMLFNPLGIAAGAVTIASLVTAPKDFGIGLLTTLIVAGFGFILAILFFQKQPPTPPTIVNADLHDMEVDSFMVGIKKLSKNKAYWQLFFSFGIGVGIVNSVLTLLPQILAPNGYSEDDASMATLAFIGSGLFGAMITGIVVDMTHFFLAMIKSIFTIAATSMALFTFCNKPNKFALVIGCSGIMGMFCFAILPLALELGVEATYPVCEGTSSGFLWTAGQIFGIILLLVMGALKEKKTIAVDDFDANFTNTTIYKDVEDMTVSMWVAVGSAAMAVAILLPMNTPYLRLQAEAKAKTDQLYEEVSTNTGAPLEEARLNNGKRHKYTTG